MSDYVPVPPKQKRFEFREDGDKELWVLHGEGWAIPVYAIPRIAEGLSPVYFIEPAISLERAAKYQKMLEVIKPLNVSNGRTLVVKRDELPKIAYKATGVTPRYYSKWNDLSEREPEGKVYETDEIYRENNSGIADSFLEFVEQETQAASLPVIKLVYAAIRKAAPVWLAEKRKPIDLGFCRIHALPLRANWKTFMDVWHPGASTILRQREEIARADILNAGFGENLCDPLLLSVDEHKRHIHWSMDIEPMPEFCETTDRIEESRRAALGEVNYLKFVRKMISDAYNQIYSIYVRWTKATHTANGEIRANLRSSAEVLFALRRLAVSHPEDCLRSQADRGRAEAKADLKEITKRRRGKAAKMRRLRNIQPAPADVRDPGEDGADPGNQ